jgi:hypothetical protein
MQVLESSTAGWFAIGAMEAPGVQGADIAGTQGIGVSVPPAAAVADATEGLLGLGSTPSDDGVTPKLHISCAVLTT